MTIITKSPFKASLTLLFDT